MKDDLKLNVSNEFNLSNNNEKDINIVLSKQSLLELGSVTGTVYSGNLISGDKVSNATVKIFKEDGTPYKHTITDKNGNYTINQLPIGVYKIATVKQKYILSNMTTLTITDKLPVTINLVLQSENDENNNIVYGKIIDKSTSSPIENVNILLYQKNKDIKKLVSSTISIVDGEYLLEKLEDGQFELDFEKQGYQTETINKIVLNNNVKFKADIILEKTEENINCTVSGIIKDNLGNIVQNAFVGLYKIEKNDETLVATTHTNAEGKYMFGNIIKGNYLVKAKLTDVGF